MKKKNLNWLLALLAALALVFAFAGCADNGAGDGGTTNPSDEEEEEDTPCCNTEGCESGSSECTACDGQDCCSDCGDNACTIVTCTNCTGGSECTGTSECTVCDECECTECSA